MVPDIFKGARFYVCVAMICGIVPVCAAYAEEGPKEAPFLQEKPAGPELPLRQAIEAEEKMEAIIDHKNALEKEVNIQKEAVMSPERSGPGILVKDNPEGLPAEVIREDGAKIVYEYAGDKKAILSYSDSETTLFMEISYEKVTISTSPLSPSKEISFIDAPVGSRANSPDIKEEPVPIVAILPPVNSEIPMDRPNLINYGRADFKKIRKAFDDLDADMQKLQEKYIKNDGAVPSRSGKINAGANSSQRHAADRLYAKEKIEITERFYKKLASALKNSSLSSAVMDGERLDAVLILPRKKGN